MKGLSLRFQGRWYDRYWADYLPKIRLNPNDRAQPWKISSYAVYDVHVSYRLPLRSDKVDVTMFAHLFNVFDRTYVSDATDESAFDGIGTNFRSHHTAQRAGVVLGVPFTFNAGGEDRILIPDLALA